MIAYPQNIAALYSCYLKEYHLSSARLATKAYKPKVDKMARMRDMWCNSWDGSFIFLFLFKKLFPYKRAGLKGLSCHSIPQEIVQLYSLPHRPSRGIEVGPINGILHPL